MIEGAGMHPHPLDGAGPSKVESLAHQSAAETFSSDSGVKPQERQLADIGLSEIEFQEANILTIFSQDKNLVESVIQDRVQLLVAHDKTRRPKPVYADFTEQRSVGCEV